MEIINTFATDEDGYAVEKFCNTLFKCISIYIYIYYFECCIESQTLISTTWMPVQQEYKRQKTPTIK